MSTGTMIFAAGIVLIILGIVFLIVIAATYSGSRRRINERMKEKY